MHAKSLEIRTRIYCGDSHLDVAGSFHNLGSVSTDGRGGLVSVFASHIACSHIQAHVTVHRSSCGFSLIRTAGSEVEAGRQGNVQLQELGAWLEKFYRLGKVGKVGKHS